MEKVVRDGKVAVLYSPGYGAGWSTWNSDDPLFVFSPSLVEMVEQGRRTELTEELVTQMLGFKENTHVYCGGADQLVIEWVPVGTLFEISEYDGNESVRYLGPQWGYVA